MGRVFQGPRPRGIRGLEFPTPGDPRRDSPKFPEAGNFGEIRGSTEKYRGSLRKPAFSRQTFRKFAFFRLQKVRNFSTIFFETNPRRPESEFPTPKIPGECRVGDGGMFGSLVASMIISLTSVLLSSRVSSLQLSVGFNPRCLQHNKLQEF